MGIQHINTHSSIGDIPCVVDSCMKDPTGELQPKTYIGSFLMQHCVHILQAHTYSVHHYMVYNYA